MAVPEEYDPDRRIERVTMVMPVTKNVVADLDMADQANALASMQCLPILALPECRRRKRLKRRTKRLVTGTMRLVTV